MALIEVEPYWGIMYNFTSEPGVHRIGTDQIGINCRALAHWYYEKRFGLTLPDDQLSLEMFTDTRGIFRIVEPGERPLEGDLYFFGRKGNDNGPQTFHVAVFTGLREQRLGLNDPLLLHATVETHRVCLWPVSKFTLYERYEVHYGIRRHRELEERLSIS